MYQHVKRLFPDSLALKRGTLCQIWFDRKKT